MRFGSQTLDKAPATTAVRSQTKHNALSRFRFLHTHKTNGLATELLYEIRVISDINVELNGATMCFSSLLTITDGDRVPINKSIFRKKNHPGILEVNLD